MYGKWASVVVVVVLAEIGAFQQDKRFQQQRGGPRVRVRHEVHNNATSSPRRPCDIDQVEYRLTRLEVQTAEKSELINSELRETNRRLQSMEWQTADVHASLEEFKTELGRFTQTNQMEAKSTRISDDLDLKIDNLAKGFQIVVAAVRNLRTDIGELKKNISTIAESTRSLVLGHDALVTKPFLTDSLVDVKHHHLTQSSTSSLRPRTANDIPENCKQVHERGNNVSGIYRVQPELAPRAFMVLCDMESRGGGWTYIHNRYEGMQDFYLNWHSYKLGFGNLGGEFWLGLEYLHQLTGYEVNELVIEMADVDGKGVYARYEAFSVGSEAEGYALKALGGYSGTAGDSLKYHAGSKFSTKDMDQDDWAEGSCAQAHTGAWWYRSCDNSNLNGRYLKGDIPDVYQYQGMYWGEFRGPQYSLLKARMMIRPRSSSSPSLPYNQDVVSPN